MGRSGGRDEEEDWLDEEEDFSFDEEDNDEPTLPCPYCRREIHEDSVRCPHCERYISWEDAPPARKPWWIVLGVIACLYVIYRWSFGM
jgi:hypothetical protein